MGIYQSDWFHGGASLEIQGSQVIPCPATTFSLAPVNFGGVTNPWNGQDTSWQGKELAGTMIFRQRSHRGGGCDGQTELLHHHHR